MTTIRPNVLPPTPSGPQRQDHDKHAAQRAFFAQALGQAQGLATAAAPTPSAPVHAPAPTSSLSPAEPPQKVLRPGSLIDIRV